MRTLLVSAEPATPRGHPDLRDGVPGWTGADLVAVSFYPFLRLGATDSQGRLLWLDEHFGKLGKP